MLSWRITKARLASYIGGLLTVFILTPSFPAQAEQMPVTLSCGSTQATLGNDLTLVSNQPFSISCTLDNASAEEYSTKLFTTQLSPGGQGSGSLSTPHLFGTTDTEVTIPFQPVFQNGTYTYTFTLIDSKTSKPLAEEVTLLGTLGSSESQQARILAATTDKGEYQWGELFTLALSLDVPTDNYLDTTPISANIVMQDKDGQTCSTLLEKRLLTKVEDTLALTFPKVAGTCVNAVGLSLESKDGTTLDQRTIAVGLTMDEAPGVAPTPGPDTERQAATDEQSGSNLSALMIGVLIFVAIFLMVLVGYTITHRKSSVV